MRTCIICPIVWQEGWGGCFANDMSALLTVLIDHMTVLCMLLPFAIAVHTFDARLGDPVHFHKY